MSDVDVSHLKWTAGSALCDPLHLRREGRFSLKILSDRWREGGGIADLVRCSPPSLPKTTSRNIGNPTDTATSGSGPEADVP